MTSCFHYFLLVFPHFLNAFLLNSPPEYQPGYGYVGPACAVFDGTLFLHGVSKRKLNDHELHIFRAYQHDLSTFKDSSSSFDSFEASFPSVPKFCGGYDDSIEVVLDSCIVRNNHVYVGEHLIRPLTNFEKQKIQLVKMRRMYGESRRKRIRRSSKTLIPGSPGTRPQRDFSEMLHKLLNINSTVTSRFLPVVSQSPLFAMEGPWQNLLELRKDKDMLELLAAAQFKPPSYPAPPSPPVVDITKIDSPYRATFTTVKPRKSQKPEKKKEVFNVFTPKVAPTTTTTTTASTTTTSTTTAAPTTPSTPRHISLQTLPPATTSRPPRPQPSSHSSSTSIQTVVDPLILKLISRALEKNEMIDEFQLKQALSMQTVQTSTTPSPLRFIIPTSAPVDPFQPTARVAGLSHNHLFIPHQPFTSLASSDSRFSAPNPLSHRLPNEICRVHANSNPFRYNVRT